MANADHVRRITAMLHTNGCTPAEAQGRLAKARQIAVREGLLAQFPQLRTPEEKAAAKASSAQAKAKASAAYHSARAAQAPPSWNGFDAIEINGVKVDLQNLSSAGLEVLATLLRKQQQEQSARNYHMQREQVLNNDIQAYLDQLKAEEAAERAAYFRERKGLWTRLAVAITLLTLALVVNRMYAGPMAFIGVYVMVSFTCFAATGLYWLENNDQWQTTQRNIDFNRRLARTRYRPR